MRLAPVFWALAITLLAPRPVPAMGFSGGSLPSIFGERDDRRLVEDKDVKPEHKKLAKSVAAIFIQEGSASPSAGLSMGSYGDVEPVYKWDAKSRSYSLVKGKYPLCEGEDENRFRGLPTGASCTAALIHPRLLLTAAHCIAVEDFCKRARFVFGFSGASKAPEGKLVVAEEDSYKCDGYFGIPQPPSEDWAIIHLTKEVRGRRALELELISEPKEESPVASIGHPAGLPAIVTGGGKVLSAPNGKPYFTSDLDLFQGNSGAPVFLGEKIVGVVSSVNAVDYELDEEKKCAKLARFRTTEAEDKSLMKSIGVISTRVSQVERSFNANIGMAQRQLRVEGEEFKAILQAKPGGRSLTPEEIARLDAKRRRAAGLPDSNSLTDRIRSAAERLGMAAGEASKPSDASSKPRDAGPK